MTSGSSAGEARRPAIVILGNDAVLAALPATPVQLAHACLRAGFSAVVPPSWGDELVAAACLRASAAHPEVTTILCSCPLVATRIHSGDADLARFAINLVSPPVAAARYVRAISVADVSLVYVGGCPSAADAAIDTAYTPNDFLRGLEQRGITPAAEPRVFDSVIPLDRRRHLSLPGGSPSSDRLRHDGGDREWSEIHTGEFASDVAQALMTGQRTLLHVAARLGCTCAGVSPARGAEEARATIAGLEPPRAVHPIVDADIPLDLTTSPEILPLVAVVASGEELAGSNGARPHEAAADASAVASSPVPRRRSPAAGSLRVAAMPRTRSGEVRALPRAYVAMRRTPPSSRSVTPPATTVLPRPSAPVASVEPERLFPSFTLSGLRTGFGRILAIATGRRGT